MNMLKPAVWGFRYRTAVRIACRAVKARHIQDCRDVSGYVRKLLLSSRYRHVEIRLIPKVHQYRPRRSMADAAGDTGWLVA